MSPSAAIVGAGAIGAWIADALDCAGWTVSILARDATLAALRAGGLRVERSGVARHSRPRAGSAAELGVHDYVFLTVKAHVLEPFDRANHRDRQRHQRHSVVVLP